MRSTPGRCALLGLAVLLASATGATAGAVELSPFFGVQFAGSFAYPVNGGPSSSGIGLHFGGTPNLAVAENWRVELLYSRQEAGLENGKAAPPFAMKLERYMAGIQEEKGDPRTRFFGDF